MKQTLKKARGIVTGASSGIGRAIAVELARAGVDLVVTARREDSLRELADELTNDTGVKVVVVPGDITDDQTRRAVIDAAKNELGGLDLLVNNAGAGATELIEATSEETARKLFDLNFFAPFLLSQMALPLLRESAKDQKKIRPTLVFLGSIVGLRGTPHYGLYGAAKGAVITFADALRTELASDRIGVLTVSPGTTSSEFFDSLLENRSMPHFPKHSAVLPETVARKTVAAIQKGRHRILPHLPSKILEILHRISPRFVDRVMIDYR